MIRLFRKIRKNLLSDKSYGMYILYASGEIVLVVVGILLALQIDKWNTQKNDRESELAILEEIYSNLERDLGDFKGNLNHFHYLQVSSRALLDVVANQSSYHDSLGYYFFYLNIFPHFTPNKSGYLLLQSRGLDLISDRHIRLAISNLYENYYAYLGPFEKERMNFNNINLEAAMMPYKGTVSLTEDLIPFPLIANTRLPKIRHFRNMINYKEFLQDTNLHGIIKDIEDISLYLFNLHKSVENQVLELRSILQVQLNEA